MLNDKDIVVKDEAERFKARGETTEWLNRSLIVEAGAGTGKTRLLIERILNLTKSGFDLNRITAITFTRKAAAEMADRLRVKLEQMVLNNNTPIPLYLMKALTELDSANVSTIDAFACKILRNYAFSIGLSPDFVVIDDEEDLELQNEVLINTLIEHDAERDKLLVEFVQLGGRIKDLLFILKSLYDNRDICVVGYNNRARLYEEIGKCKVKIKDIMEDDENNYSVLKILSQTNKNHLGEAANWFSSDAHNVFKEEMSNLKQCACETMNLARQSVFSQLIEWENHIVKKLIENKLKMGKLNFRDLLIYTKQLIEKKHIKDEIIGRYQKLLIDEFQDTDPLQVEIALNLAGIEFKQIPSLPGGQILQDPGRIFVVGDPKQSIYRFRNADTRIYKAAVDNILMYGQKIPIIQNFRSAPAIIEFVNEVCGYLWSKYASVPEEWQSLAYSSHISNLSPSPPVLIGMPQEQIDKNNLRKRDLRQIEADLIAEIIDRIVNKEHWLVRDPQSLDITREASLGDIVILFPKTTDIDLYIDALMEREIPHYIVGGKNQLKRQIVRDLANCIAAIDNPLDDLTIYGALRSYIFGVPDIEIEQFTNSNNGKLDYRISNPEPVSNRLKEALTLLHNLHSNKRTLTAGQIIDRLLNDTYAKVALKSLSIEGKIDAEILQYIDELAYEKGIETEIGLRSFYRYLLRCLESDDILQKAPARETKDQVRLMTVHSAKGLEFPIVILANLNDKTIDRGNLCLTDRLNKRLHLSVGTKSKGLFETDRFQDALKDEKRLMLDERLHILYVAMTRARDHLVITQNIYPKPEGYNKWIDEALKNDVLSKKLQVIYRKEVISVSKPVKSKLALKEPIKIDKGEVWSDYNSWNSYRLNALSSAKDKILLIISPSKHTKEYKEQEVIPLQQFKGEFNKLVRVGSAVHKYMAVCPLKDDIDEELLINIALKEDVLTDDIEYLINNALKGEVWQTAIKSNKLWREVPITVRVDNRIINGYIDLIYKNEKGDFFIADYKTGEIDINRHRDQLKEYCEALEKALKSKIIAGYVHYLTVNQVKEFKF